MAFEKVRVRCQVVVDRPLREFLFDKFRFRLRAHKSMIPLEIYSAFPVSQTGSDPPRQLTTSWPPGSRTLTDSASSPSDCPATTAAQAPVPHAAVSPTPRSNT